MCVLGDLSAKVEIFVEKQKNIAEALLHFNAYLRAKAFALFVVLKKPASQTKARVDEPSEGYTTSASVIYSPSNYTSLAKLPSVVAPELGPFGGGDRWLKSAAGSGNSTRSTVGCGNPASPPHGGGSAPGSGFPSLTTSPSVSSTSLRPSSSSAVSAASSSSVAAASDPKFDFSVLPMYKGWLWVVFCSSMIAHLVDVGWSRLLPWPPGRGILHTGCLWKKVQ